MAFNDDDSDGDDNDGDDDDNDDDNYGDDDIAVIEGSVRLDHLITIFLLQ